MFQFPISKFQKNGFSLIEGMVGVAIFLIISLALFSLFNVAFNSIRNNKAKVTANSIALEELEVIRGMEFDSIATTTGWVPPGPILSEKDINRGSFNFTVKIDITFVDDSFDGTTTSAPADTFPFDYKKARVKVIWANPITKGQETVAMSTNIVPPGLEGGTGLYVTVFDASGQPINEAKVDITSVNESYILDDALTDPNGNLWVPNLEPNNDYHITATKDGYSVAQTYAINTDPASPDYNPNPTKPDAIVIDGEVTRVGLAIDVLGNLNIQTVNYNNPQNWKINSDLGADSQTEVAIAIDSGDNLFLVWLDDRVGPERFYAQKYKYNSVSGLYEKQWDPDVQITVANNKRAPRISVFGTSYFYIVGADDRNGNQDIFLEKYNSSTGNSEWNDVKVNVDANSNAQVKPDIAVDSVGNSYIAWMDDRNGNWDVYAQKYDPDGNNLWVADLKINIDAGIHNQENPRAVVDDEDNFYVVWEDEINGNKDIFLAKFDGDGNTLFAGKKINTDSSGLDQYEPNIVFDGSDYLYLCWSDKRNSQPDIYAGKYDKAGTRIISDNWVGGDVKINDDSMPDAWRTKSAVAYFSDSAIYFSWQDDRNGNPDIYSAKFDSGGNKLWAYDLIMNGIASDDQGAPDVVTDSMGYGITVWEDFRSGDADIYAARYKDLGFFIRTGIPITVTGVKLKGTYPPDSSPIYKYSKDFTSDGVGNISIGDGTTVIEWDNYSFTAGDGHTVISTDQPEPLFIAPGTTENVVINVEP